MSERPTRKRNPRGQGERLRRELIDAATALLAELGDAERLSIRAVARRAGVTPPSIYRHFEDKQSLVSAVLEERFGEFNRFLAEAEGAASDPYDALSRRCHAYLEFAREHPGHYRVLFGTKAPMPSGRHPGRRAAPSDERPRAGAVSFFALVDAIQRCLDAGAGSDRDSSFLAVELWTLLHGVVDLRLTYPDLPWPAAEEITDAVRTQAGLGKPNLE
ncbi:MAG: TetR/AcrR family transcriptional regulator [Actinobacteria bacterium]|nr:MAG: TetR/AcrR family transcriptional regulator [Actinomycetota bacterium]TMK49144.1 MAG: TetR/AcrR family transcriptional regulator [Actinomycetota bacterium]